MTFSLKLPPCIDRIVVSGTRRCDHISPVLRQLHWLPVRQRVDFKLAMLVYKALKNLAPQYLSDDCQLVAATSRRQLRSSGNFKCTLTSTSTRLGDRAFAAAGPRLWNHLPAEVRRPDLSLDTFCQKLKTYLFVRGTSAEWLLFLGAVYKLTYLLTYLLTYWLM